MNGSTCRFGLVVAPSRTRHLVNAVHPFTTSLSKRHCSKQCLKPLPQGSVILSSALDPGTLRSIWVEGSGSSRLWHGLDVRTSATLSSTSDAKTSNRKSPSNHNTIGNSSDGSCKGQKVAVAVAASAVISSRGSGSGTGSRSRSRISGSSSSRSSSSSTSSSSRRRRSSSRCTN